MQLTFYSTELSSAAVAAGKRRLAPSSPGNGELPASTREDEAQPLAPRWQGGGWSIDSSTRPVCGRPDCGLRPGHG
jgi:hypothetical protein